MKLVCLIAVLITAIAAAVSEQQLDWEETYTGYPQPQQAAEYIEGEQLFTCDAPFALCSFAGEFRCACSD